MANIMEEQQVLPGYVNQKKKIVQFAAHGVNILLFSYHFL